jgi:hypothetical protein
MIGRLLADNATRNEGERMLREVESSNYVSSHLEDGLHRSEGPHRGMLVVRLA